METKRITKEWKYSLEKSLKDVTIVGNKRSLRSKKKDENESYAGELCQIIDNSENESKKSEGGNYAYELNNSYETMIEVEMCSRIFMMKIKDWNHLQRTIN